PECRFTRAFAVDAEAEAAGADIVLGNEPASGLGVAVKKGHYGHYIQLGEGGNGAKPKRVALRRGLKPADVDLDTALRLLALPRGGAGAVGQRHEGVGDGREDKGKSQIEDETECRAEALAPDLRGR